MLLNEEKILENLKTPYNKFFVPLIWASELVMRARTEGRIKDDFAVKTLIDVRTQAPHPHLMLSVTPEMSSVIPQMSLL